MSIKHRLRPGRCLVDYMRSDNTKQKIFNALAELMKTEPLDKITVSDIAKKAKISRQTFYYHFSTIYSIFDWFILKEIPYSGNGEGSGIYAPSPAVCVAELCTCFEKNKDIVLEFRRVFYDEYAQNVRCYLGRIIHANLEYLFPPTVDRNDLDVFTRFMIDGYTGVITRWFKSDMQIDIREVFRGIYTTLAKGVSTDPFGKAVHNIPLGAIIIPEKKSD